MDRIVLPLFLCCFFFVSCDGNGDANRHPQSSGAHTLSQTTGSGSGAGVQTQDQSTQGSGATTNTTQSTSSSSTHVPTPLYVFITSQRFMGNIGSIIDADKTCKELADGAIDSLGGTPLAQLKNKNWKAWLSDSDINNSPAFRFESAIGDDANRPYVMLKRDNSTVQIAANWKALVSGTLENQIQITETGNNFPNFSSAGFSSQSVWTNTTYAGERKSKDSTCNNWSSSTADAGMKGEIAKNPAIIDYRWTDTFSSSCNSANALYCFEQP
jgi:hypothetical protein